MASILITPPAVEPFTIAEAKVHLRIEHDDDDAFVASLIAAARCHVEARMRRALIVQTWRIVLDDWPGNNRIMPPLLPLRQVIAVRVYDHEGVAEPLAPALFVADVASGVIGIGEWAVRAPGRSIAGIELDVELGYGASAADVPSPMRQAMRILLRHWYDYPDLDGAATRPLFADIDEILAPYRVLSL